MKRLIPLLLLSMISLGALSACHTMEGAGRDIQQAGEAIEEEANEEAND